MRSEWVYKSVEDCVEAIIDYRGKTPVKVTAGVPLITAKIVKNGRIAQAEEFITEGEYASWMRRGLPQKGDVLLTTEAPLGEVAQITNEHVALAQRIILLRGKPQLLDNTYLKYCFMGEFIQEQLHSRVSGTTVFGIKQSELRKVTVPIPPLAEQKAIARILSSLDDKIELNRRMNATLETMAQTLFRAWFVDFEPVKAKSAGRAPVGLDAATAALFPSEFEESERLIPKGWTPGTLADICDVRRDTVQPSSVEAETPYIGLEHMPQKSIALDSWGFSSQAESVKSRFDKMDILFGKLRPYFHKVGVAPISGICSTDILVLRPKQDAHFGLALSVLSSEDLIAYASRLADGAKMPRVNWKDIAAYPIVLPPKEVQAEFSKFAQDMVATIHSNISQSRTLAQLRDALLPRLISGQLRVLEVEEFVSQAT